MDNRPKITLTNLNPKDGITLWDEQKKIMYKGKALWNSHAFVLPRDAYGQFVTFHVELAGDDAMIPFDFRVYVDYHKHEYKMPVIRNKAMKAPTEQQGLASMKATDRGLHV